MALTQEQINKMNRIISNSTGVSPQEFYSGQKLPPIKDAIRNLTEKPNYGERVKDDFLGGISAAKKDITSQDNRSALSKGVSAVSNVAGAISAPLMEAPGFKQVGKLFEKGINLSGEQLSKLYSPEFTKSLADLPDEEFNKATQLLQDLSNTGNIANTILAAKGLKEGGQKTATLAKEGLIKTGEGISKVAQPITNKVKDGLDMFSPKDKPAAIKNIRKAYSSSFIDDSTAINKQLTNVAKKYKDTVGGKVKSKTPDQLLDDLVAEGIIPEVEGKLAKFDKALEENTQKIKDTRAIIKDSVSKYNELTDIDQLKSAMEADLRKTGNALELKASLKELDNKIASIKEKYGNKLKPETLDEIRVDANAKSGAFDTPLSEADASGSIGNAIRARLDEIIPDEVYRNANKEITKLKQLEDTMKVFDNRTIKVNPLLENLGSLGGTIGLGATIGGAVSGSGALVVAGIFAQLGAKVVADFMRNKKFSPKAVEIIKETYKAQPEALTELINQASKQDAKVLEQFRKSLELPTQKQLPEKTQTKSAIPLPPKSSKSSVKVISAKKNPVTVNPKTNKFQTTYSSQ